MSARDTFVASIILAEQAKIATLIAAETTKQETVNATGVNVGYNLQTGNYANFAAGVKSANIAKWNSVFNAEQAKQASVELARDTLRGTGDKGPF